MKSVGEQLQLARLYKKWTLQAAAKATKIKMDRLSDLEKDNFSKFASPAYARGFVRIYARSLGLDERKILAQLDGKLSQEEEVAFVSAPAVEYIPEHVEMTAPLKAGRLGQKVIYILAGAFVFIILVTLVKAYQAGFFSNRSTEVAAKALPLDQSANTSSSAASADSPEPPRALPVQPSVAQAVPVNNPNSSAPPAAVPVAVAAVPVATAVAADVPVAEAVKSHQITLKATGSSWIRVVEIRDGKENELFSGLLNTGEARTFQGQQFTVKVEVPSVVDITFDGVDYGPYSDSQTPETFTIPNLAQND